MKKNKSEKMNKQQKLLEDLEATLSSLSTETLIEFDVLVRSEMAFRLESLGALASGKYLQRGEGV